MTSSKDNKPMRGEIAEPTSGAKYITKVASFINGELLPPGVEVEYDGFPGANLQPINAAAKAAAAEYKKLKNATYPGDDAAERYANRQAALAAAADKRQGKTSDDSEEEFAEADPELLKHAEQTKADTAAAAADDPDVHGVKMSGEQTNVQRSTKDQTPDDKSKPDAAKAK